MGSQKMALQKLMLRVVFSKSRSLSQPLLVASYHEKVIDHYEKPRNVGSLDKNSVNVGTGLVGAPACGDVMKLQIQVDENGKNTDIAKELSLPPVKLHCSMLAEDAIKAALKDFEIKQSSRKKTPNGERAAIQK